MAIVFHCTCGHALRTQDDSAGKKTRCPACNQVLTIPAKPAAVGAHGPTPAHAPTPAHGHATAHGHAPTSGGHATMVATGPALDQDPFAMELDWASLKAAPHVPAQEMEQARPIISGGAIKVDSAPTELAHPEVPAPEDGSRQYRVLTQKDPGLTGKFNGLRLEEVLNDHASRGWCLKAAFAMNMPGHGGHHDELVVILER
ncbi:DUF4177 domain-containing protein [Isosphaeraceae bacterium EP7]